MKTHWERQQAKESRDRAVLKWAFGLFFTAVVLIVVFFAAGCAGPVIPHRVESTVIAFEGNEQNAGVLAVSDQGAILTEHKKAEYDGLVERYGRGTPDYPINPPVELEAGLKRVSGPSLGFPDQGWVWRMDREHLTWFLTFREWQRAGRPPR